MLPAKELSANRPYDPIQLSSPAFWSATAAEREQSFSILRSERPVSWHAPVIPALSYDPDDYGFWAITRHSDIITVSRNNDAFKSSDGVILPNIPDKLKSSQFFLAMDPPQHTKYRKLMRASFTPRQVNRIEKSIRSNARSIINELRAMGSGCDFVEFCSKQLPMRTIADIVGIPASERDAVARASEALIQWTDPKLLKGRDPIEFVLENEAYIYGVAARLAAERRERPGDDLLTSMVQAEVDGDRLSDHEVGACFLLIVTAGNNTTRSTTSHALKAMTDFPDERKWLLDDLEGRIGCAVEEFIRWATPVVVFCRTAATDIELSGRTILAGEKVALFYSSGNRDAQVFEDPTRLNLSRDPNPHIGFGGGGAHFCLGAHVARTQLRAIIPELLRQLPDIQAGDPVDVPGFSSAIRSMPCYF